MVIKDEMTAELEPSKWGVTKKIAWVNIKRISRHETEASMKDDIK